MDFVNISAIYHVIQDRQPLHYQTIKNLKRGNVRDVRDKKRKNYFHFYCSLIILNDKSANFSIATWTWPRPKAKKMRAAEAGAACVPTYWRILTNKTEATYSSLTTACNLDSHFIETGTISQPITQSTLNIRLQIGVDRHQGNSGQGCHIFETAPKGITFLT